jgi:hypothetical protein
MDDIHHLFIPRSARSLRVGLQGIDNLKRGIKPDVGIVRVAIEVGTVSAMLGFRSTLLKTADSSCPIGASLVRCEKPVRFLYTGSTLRAMRNEEGCKALWMVRPAGIEPATLSLEG